MKGDLGFQAFKTIQKHYESVIEVACTTVQKFEVSTFIYIYIQL